MGEISDPAGDAGGREEVFSIAVERSFGEWMLSTTEFSKALAFEYWSELGPLEVIGEDGGCVWGGGLAIYIILGPKLIVSNVISKRTLFSRPFSE